MTDEQMFPIVCTDGDSQITTHGDVCTENMAPWYAPGSAPYNNNPYMTPYPSSTFETFPSTTAESSPWTSNEQLPSNPGFVTQYNLQALHCPQLEQVSTSNPFGERPRSSPSTFGPAEIMTWSEPGLGIHWTVSDHAEPAEPAYTAASYNPHQHNVESLQAQQHRAQQRQQQQQQQEQQQQEQQQQQWQQRRRRRRQQNGQPLSTPSPPEQRFYPQLAPDPAGLAAKRRRDEEEDQSLSSSGKRRKRTPSAASVESLTDDDRLLVALKEEEALPWKDIAARFSNEKGKSVQVAALQMRYKRLRERVRTWDAIDVDALQRAHDWWEKCKWDIISQRMLEYGVAEKWGPRYCARKWQELQPQPPQQPLPSTQPMHTPHPPSQYSSPAAGSHYGYVSLQ